MPKVGAHVCVCVHDAVRQGPHARVCLHVHRVSIMYVCIAQNACMVCVCVYFRLRAHVPNHFLCGGVLAFGRLQTVSATAFFICVLVKAQVIMQSRPSVLKSCTCLVHRSSHVVCVSLGVHACALACACFRLLVGSNLAGSLVST